MLGDGLAVYGGGYFDLNVARVASKLKVGIKLGGGSERSIRLGGGAIAVTAGGSSLLTAVAFDFEGSIAARYRLGGVYLPGNSE